MKILMTGATGYLGGRLAAALRRQGKEVHAVVRSTSSADSLIRLGVVVHADPGDGSRLADILGDVRPQLVYHLASCYLWDHRPEDVPRLLNANLDFPTRLAEAASIVGAGLVNAGSGFQHAGGERRPVNLYAVTKQAFEDILSWYTDARGLLAVTVVLNDTYGPMDPRRKLFHQLRSAARAGQKLEMSPGEQVVDLLHVDDAVSAFQAAAAALSGGYRWWLATGGNPLPLREVVERWALVKGVEAPVSWGGGTYREREVMSPWLTGDPPPGWFPLIDLEQGMMSMERDP